MPDDFPQVPYEAVHRAVGGYLAKMDVGDKPPEWWGEWAAAWNGLALRFLSCDRHDHAYRAQTLRSASPNHDELCTQEEELFDFFMNGWSALENACYALFAIGWALEPAAFAEFDTDAERRKIDARKTESRFRAAFPRTSLALELGKLVRETRLEAWRNVRRILFHRTSPGRVINAGGPQHGRAIWKLKDTSTAQPIALDVDTTSGL
jgi:hypothetical protein